MARISPGALVQIEIACETYGLLNPADPIPVAFSGGKDSTFLALALRELGMTVLPVAVDMGYQVGWSDTIPDLLT